MLTLEDRNALNASNLSKYFSKKTSMRLLCAKLDQPFVFELFSSQTEIKRVKKKIKSTIFTYNARLTRDHRGFSQNA